MRVNAIVRTAGGASDGIGSVYLCEDCLVKHLEMLTGYRIGALLRRWHALSGSPKSILGLMRDESA